MFYRPSNYPHILVIPSWYFTEDQPNRGCYFRSQILALKRFGYRVGVIIPELLPLNKAVLQGNLYNSEIFVNDSGVNTYKVSITNWIPLIPSAKKCFINTYGLKVFKKYIHYHGKPDIIHAHSAIFGGLLAAEIKHKYKIPFVVTEHLSALVFNPFVKWRQRYAKEVYKYADARISVSPQFAEKLSQTFSMQLESWHCIPNLLDYCFHSLTPKLHISNPKKRFYFLTIGNLVPIKGHQDLLKAFACAFAENATVALHIVGTGPMRGNLESLVHKLKISEQIVFWGQLSREAVVETILNSNVLVSSSRFETFGVALIEALACGLPVISTTSGGPESIVNEFNGILVPPDDVRSLSAAMIRIYELYAHYNHYQIRNDSLKLYGDLPIIGKLSEIYDSVLNKYTLEKECKF